MLAIFWFVLTVEKNSLLRVDQFCASGGFPKLHRRHRDRHPFLVAIQNVGINDALVRHDVLVESIIDVGCAFMYIAIELSSSDPEVKLIGLRKPLSFGFGIGPG